MELFLFSPLSECEVEEYPERVTTWQKKRNEAWKGAYAGQFMETEKQAGNEG